MRMGAPPLIMWAGAALLASTAYGAYCLYAYRHDAVILLMLAQGAIYAGAVWLLLRRPGALAHITPARALVAILTVAALMRLALLFMPPVSTDVYRYVWDGRVQASGVNPYLYVPADPALAHLRDSAIYPLINRKEYAPTIYPPMAQAIYFAATRVSETVAMMKAAMLAFEALTIWAIVQLLAMRGIPLNRVLLYAWHPLPVWEIAGSGHIDAVAISFMMLAFVGADRRSPWLAGAALGAGVATKFLPIIAGPALYRLWDWRLPAAFIATIVALYALYASAGLKIFGFLGGYAQEQELTSGAGFYLWALLNMAAPPPSAGLPIFLALGAAALAAFALRSVLMRKDDLADLQGAFIVLLIFTLIVSPHHAWYLLWLTPFLCFYPSLAALYATLAAALLYRLGWPPDAARASLLYGPFALLLLWDLYHFLTVKEARHGGPARTATSA